MVKSMALPAGVKADYLSDPRVALAQELAKAGSSTAPVASPMAGLARALQGAVAGYQADSLRNEYRQRGQDYNATLAKALQAGAGSPAQLDMPGPNMDGAAGHNVPAKPGNSAEMMRILSANEDTSPVGQQLLLTQVMNQMDPDKALKQALIARMQGGPTPQAGGAQTAPIPPTAPSTTPPTAPATQVASLDPETMKMMTVADPAMANAVINQDKFALDQKLADPSYKGDVAEREAAAKSTVARMDEYIKTGQVAKKQLNLIKIAQKIPLDGGELAPAKAKVDALAKAFGIDTTGLGLEDANNAQAFTGIMQDMVLQKQIAQKGPQTEADAKRMESTLARLGNTPEARQFLLDIGEVQVTRDAEFGEFLTNWYEGKGTYKGAEKAWNEGPGGQPLPIEWDKYQAAPASQVEGQPAQGGAGGIKFLGFE